MPSALKVSVVVPVYNPGDHIDDLLASFDAQTLAPDAFEAVLVDDGSTDGTGERLDAWAAERPWAVVEHIPNSGWPGTPRNVGLGLAHGEYVLFADNDDWLDPEALERLHARAVADDADVVVPKTVGHGKMVPRGVFRTDRREVPLDWEPLLRLLSPHKLFRRALLEEHGIRFPDGKVRLEDHLFVMHAYFHAARISVLADHPIYHWALRHGHNASATFDPAAYYRDLRRVLDLIDEHVEPGELRDHLHAHWYRSKVLKRAGGSNLADRAPEEQRAMHRELVAIAAERFPDRLDARLVLTGRIRSALLRRGDLDALLRWAVVEREYTAVAEHTDVVPDGADLLVSVEARLGGEHGPLRLRQAGDRLEWVPPAEVAELLAGIDLDVSRDRERDWLEVFVRSIERRTELPLAPSREERLEPLEDGLVTPVLSAQARLSTDGERPLPPGDWVVVLLPRIAGFLPTAKRVADAGGDLVVVADEDGVELRDGWKRTLSRRAPGLVGRVRRLSQAARR